VVFTLFGWTEDRTAKSCDMVRTEKLSRWPQTILPTLTRDRGKENQEWQKIEHEFGLKVFFAHPYHS